MAAATCIRFAVRQQQRDGDVSNNRCLLELIERIIIICWKNNNWIRFKYHGIEEGGHFLWHFAIRIWFWTRILCISVCLWLWVFLDINILVISWEEKKNVKNKAILHVLFTGDWIQWDIYKWNSVEWLNIASRYFVVVSIGNLY